jgi:stage II sporulation protein D
LRSTSFMIEHHTEHVHFKGRGFGHGVGLCQEGAIHMAELDYAYPEILHTYYTDVHLIDRKLIEFFRE